MARVFAAALASGPKAWTEPPAFGELPEPGGGNVVGSGTAGGTAGQWYGPGIGSVRSGASVRWAIGSPGCWKWSANGWPARWASRPARQ